MTETTTRKSWEQRMNEHRGAQAIVRDLAEDEPARRCWVGKGLDGNRCGREAAMAVYGLPMCREHGEEAASGALAELYHDAEEAVRRPMNPYVSRINPEAERALEEAADGLLGMACEAEDDEELMLRAFPLRREAVGADLLAYLEDPDSEENRNCEPPYDDHMGFRLLVHRLMRIAFEGGAHWLVELLEPQRKREASRAAYALALEREAGLRS